MSFQVRIYYGDQLYEISLSGRTSVTIGSGPEDDLIVPSGIFTAGHLSFTKRNDKWYLKNKSDPSTNRAGLQVRDNYRYVFDKAARIATWIYSTDTRSAVSFNIGSLERITVGRKSNNDLVLKDPTVSGIHVIFRRTENGFTVIDQKSTWGTYLNSQLMTPGSAYPINEGDRITVCAYTITFQNGRLFALIGNPKDLNAPGEDYPYWLNRKPRLIESLPTDKIKIDYPPAPPSRPEGFSVLSIMMPIVMIMSLLFSLFFFATSPAMLAFSLPMASVSMFAAIYSSNKRKKNYENTIRFRTEKYSEYLNSIEERIVQLKKEQIMIQERSDPAPDSCAYILRHQTENLWDRRPEDSDSLKLRVGKGKGRAAFTIELQQKSFSLEEDPLVSRAQEIAKKSRNITGVPVQADLFHNRVLGIVGDRKEVVNTARNLILQIAAHHSYYDIKLVTITGKQDNGLFEWIKWLPHSFNDARTIRYYSSCDESAEQGFKAIEEDLKQRLLAEKEAGIYPVYVFLVTQKEFQDRMNVLHYTRLNRDLGVRLIYLYDNINQLPKECDAVIEFEGSEGKIYSLSNINEKQTFRPDRLTGISFDEFARRMAPWRLQDDKDNMALPSNITFMEGFGLTRPSDYNVAEYWDKYLPNRSMSVPIGVKADGEPFYFDIHEKAYGPHGLVAGMTGSGKSELIQSWILAMALKFSPQQISFVLIDFKGTGLILPFRKLPHLAGTISDIDKSLTRNLIALQNELSRRKALFDRHGVSNIKGYLELRERHPEIESLTYLFIVIDEYAEFKVQFPEFTTVIESTFAIGRTLGVHIILLTQKPSGVVNDKMNANTRFRWCLKVASSADSKEMLHHPDAAKLTAPGRAYIQVGEDEVFELIQSYYSGAPYRPDRNSAEENTEKDVYLISENGERTCIAKKKSEQDESYESEIEVMISYLHDYAEKNHVPSARRIWTEKLPEELYLPDLQTIYENGPFAGKYKDSLCVPAGLIDDPAAQKQYPLMLDISGAGSVAVFGAPSTGKTTFLMTAVMSLINNYSPDMVNIYIMDFGGWNTGIFRDYPQVGGVVNSNEGSKIEKLAQLIESLLDERKQQFSEEGIGNIADYIKYTGVRIPYVLLAVDNFAPVLQLFPKLDRFFIRLTQEGGNYGIYLLATANTRGALGYKLTQNIKTMIALQMSDRSDYADIVGKTGGMEPEPFAGRGLVRGKPPLEFQTAMPYGEHGSIMDIRNAGKALGGSWEGNTARPVPIMPETIPYGSIKAAGCVLGLATDSVVPVTLPDDRKFYYLVLGTKESGKTNMLWLIARQLCHTPGDCWFFSVRPDTPKECHDSRVQFYTEVSDLNRKIEELVHVLNERQEAFEKEKGGFPGMYVLIDDFDSAFDQMEDMTARRLEALVRMGEGLNVHLIIACDKEVFIRRASLREPITSLMAKENSGILLGSSFSGYQVFSSQLSQEERIQILPAHEAYLLNRGEARKFKAMQGW